jgi:nitrite reductase/ring-hydroxylating ferredoxin subunit
MKKEQTTVDVTCGHACPCTNDGAEPKQIGRRQFVAFGAAALAAAALAACSAGSDLTSPSVVTATSLKLSDFPALASVGGVTTTTVSGVPIAIVRTSASSFSAFSRICPHQGSTINVTTGGFVCPNHGATFNSSGQWTGGQRTSNLRSYPVQYDSAAGTLTVGS